MEQQQNNNKMTKVFQVLGFIVQLLPLIIRFLGSLGGKSPAPVEDDTPDSPTPSDSTSFTHPN